MEFRKGLMIGLGIVAAFAIGGAAFAFLGGLFASQVGNDFNSRVDAEIARTRAETARIKAQGNEHSR